MDTTLLNHFGLRDQPFGVTPDPRYLYESHTHREALASLGYGLSSRRGFLSLIGQPGMGKTTLLFRLLEEYRQTALTAFLFQTQCDSREFLAYLLEDLGLDCHDFSDPVSMHRRFSEMLEERASNGQRCIIVIDEAQNLDNQVLETVRLLSDCETPRSKLLQIILAGQPALGEKLADPSLAQLRQRISVQCSLTPLSRQEVDEYIAYRLHVAGYAGNGVFTPEARGRIADLSEGVPRVISNICFSAMSLACATGQRQVTPEIVEEVGTDLGLAVRPEAILSNKDREFRYAQNEHPQAGAAEDENISVLDPPSAPRTWGTPGHCGLGSTAGTAHAADPSRPAVMSESIRSSKSQGRRGSYPARFVERTIITMACGAAILAFALAWLAHRTQESGQVSPPWNSGSSTSPGSAQKSATSQVGAERRSAILGHRGGAGMLLPIHAGEQTPARTEAKVPALSEQKLRSPQTSASKAAARTNNPVHNESTVRGTLEEVVQPVYPEEAREAEIEGTVTLQAKVDATGNVRDVRVLEGEPVLAEAALDAVRRWRYRPYLENGTPVMFRTIIKIRFVLDGASPPS